MTKGFSKWYEIELAELKRSKLSEVHTLRKTIEGMLLNVLCMDIIDENEYFVFYNEVNKTAYARIDEIIAKETPLLY